MSAPKTIAPLAKAELIRQVKAMPAAIGHWANSKLRKPEAPIMKCCQHCNAPLYVDTCLGCKAKLGHEVPEDLPMMCATICARAKTPIKKVSKDQTMKCCKCGGRGHISKDCPIHEEKPKELEQDNKDWFTREPTQQPPAPPASTTVRQRRYLQRTIRPTQFEEPRTTSRPGSSFTDYRDSPSPTVHILDQDSDSESEVDSNNKSLEDEQQAMRSPEVLDKGLYHTAPTTPVTATPKGTDYWQNPDANMNDLEGDMEMNAIITQI